jgi:glucuronoarabinoxylan endo-1,4-beta-xylanase
MAVSSYSAALNRIEAATAAAPRVTSTLPANKAADAAITPGTVTATFSEAMNAATIDAATFKLTGPGAVAVPGTVTYSAAGSIAKFKPAASLKYGTLYTAAITTGAKSKAGVALAASYKWTFTTMADPLRVSSTLPANGATGVAIGQVISASFSKPMNAATIDAATFKLTQAGGAAVAGKVSYVTGGSIARFTPIEPLAFDTTYTATILTAARDTAGVALATDTRWTFTTASMPANTATVNFGSSAQIIRGFGGSTAWITNLTPAQADTIFGTGDGQLGLSMLRVRIDPSSTTGGAANWGEELNNAQLATARGASVMATPWTPPTAWKLDTDAANALWGGYLDPAHYGDYANYLESFVTYFANNGVKLYAISMQNEPDAVVNYESCSWDGAQMDTWVANNSSVLTTKFMMPESEDFNPSLSDPALDDPSAVGHISIVAGHIYGYGETPFYYSNAEGKGKEVWMTEHYLNGSGISGALALAMEVHNSMTVAEYNAYLWWWIFDYPAGGYGQGLVDAMGNPTPNGYAMAQFSRFVRPGDVRANATYSPSPNVYVSAYKGTGHTAIVAINMGATSVSQPFLIQGKTVTSVTPYRTSATQNVVPLDAISVKNGYFVETLPAQSITTFVQ